MTWAVGIDLGGTVLKAVAVTADGLVRERAAYPIRDIGVAQDRRVAQASNLLCGKGRLEACATRVMMELEQRQGAAASAVGVCAPGLASKDGRSIAHLPGKLAGVEGLDWTRALGCGARVPVLNDAHAALLGEAWIGAARQHRDVVLLTLGTGVGGAVLSEGRLLRGAIGRAGHLGHMSLDREGPRSIVGMPGAVEVMVGDYTIRERTNGKFSSTADLITAHLEGDAFATEVWLRSIHALATAIASYINLFDPEIIVIGGGIAKAGEALFAPLQAEVDRIEWRPGGHAVSILPAVLGEWAGAIGAAREALIQR
jgi:glucokinase